MIELLRRLFRKKIKALILIRPGEIRGGEKAFKVLMTYAEDQGAGVITVNNPESIRVLTFGKGDRLLVPMIDDKEAIRVRQLTQEDINDQFHISNHDMSFASRSRWRTDG